MAREQRSTAPEPALLAQLERYLGDQLESGAAATELAASTSEASVSRMTDARLRGFEALLIESGAAAKRDRRVAALHGEGAPIKAPARALLETWRMRCSKTTTSTR